MWCIDVDWETKNFLSGAADNTIRLWDVETGKTIRYVRNGVYLYNSLSLGGSMK